MSARRCVTLLASVVLGAVMQAPPARAGAGKLEATAQETAKLEAMPPALETQFALSALPPGLRAQASVQLLDPAKGYRMTRQGTNGMTCVVERTQWEVKELRDDVYIPLCYDAAGTEAHLKAIVDTAALRARGLDAAAIFAEISAGYANKTYRAPEKPGLSYMLSPVFRAPGPPDMRVHTLAMPHTMVYAPNATNADIGAAPDFSHPASLHLPFIDRQGNGEQSYVIHLVGDAEKAAILASEKDLIAALCAHREVLCLEQR